MERHMFVCGSTGAGKSNFLQFFLMNFKKHYKTPIMLVEFKGEYNFLQEKLNDLLIIRPGENFSINIFNPEGSNPEVHAERIFAIFKSAQMLEAHAEFTPQMQKVLVDILTEVCSSKEYQSWEGFYEKCEEYLQKEKRNIPFLDQSIISVKNRIRRFSVGPIKAIFETKNKLDVKKLFERDILIDLSSIIRLGGEKEDAIFFLNMILKYLWDKNLSKGSEDYTTIRHMTIIEDAQYFAPRGLSDKTKISTYIEDIALLLRGTGECLITIATRPDVSEEILANCGVLITFKNHMQKETLRKLLNLDEEHEEYLSMLQMGYCIIRVNSIEKPFLLYIPYIKRHSLTLDQINANNKRILQKSESEENGDFNQAESKKNLLNKSLWFKKLKDKIKFVKLRKKTPKIEKRLEENDLIFPKVKKENIKTLKIETENPNQNRDEDFFRLEKLIKNLAQKDNRDKNPKSLLHEFCQQNHFKLPIYKVINRDGPNHSPTYTVELSIVPGTNINNFQGFFKNRDDTIIGKAKSKKLAENDAAKRMCDVLGL
ncbi:MAG: hypothetical protein CEE43_01855 [Promethearchaeota archaeon Loki_b32]|nr:MAG: hypothetical protein CEE43_01855 [Candidatus Lokiarchaeota archaeon Loki_b32]